MTSDSEEPEVETHSCFMEKVERSRTLKNLMSLCKNLARQYILLSHIKLKRRGDYISMLKDMVGPDTPRRWRDFKELVKLDFRLRIKVSEREKRMIFEDFMKALDQGQMAEDGQRESNEPTLSTLQPALRREIKEKLLLLKQKIDELMDMIQVE